MSRIVSTLTQASSILFNLLLSCPTQIGAAYRVVASLSESTPLTGSIGFHFFGRDIDAQKEELLRVYFNDGAAWRELVTVVDPEHNIATAQLQDAGIYALMYSINVMLVANEWNLVSYPISDTRDITVALSSLQDYNPIIYGYDPSKQPFERWQVYSTELPGWANTLMHLRFSQGYWISVTHAASVTWHLADVSAAHATFLTPPAVYYGLVESDTIFTPQPGLPVYAWVSNTLCGIGQTQMVNGQTVYSVMVYADGPDEAVGCGATGRSLHFSIGSYAMQNEAMWSNHQVSNMTLSPVNQNYLYLPLISR
jgi:hypothetical protein